MTERSPRAPSSSAAAVSLACAIGALLGVAPGGAARAAESLCAASERVLFSCGVREKTVAVCASSDLAAERGTLQYRFGTPAKLELALPAGGVDWRGVVHGGTLVFSGGGGAFLAFDRTPYRYVVYSAIGRGWGEKAGVAVERDGRRIASLPCTTAESSSLGPDLFSDAAVPESESEFRLP